MTLRQQVVATPQRAGALNGGSFSIPRSEHEVELVRHPIMSGLPVRFYRIFHTFFFFSI